MKKIKLIDIIISIVYLAVASLVFTGFFFPDPHTLHQLNPQAAGLFLVIVKIVAAVFLLGILLVYHLVRFKVVPLKALIVSLVATAMCVMIVAIAGYARFSGKEKLAKIYGEFHPYLQLIPQTIVMDDMDDPDIISIACLGGSTTEFLDSTGKGWPERLQQKLSASIPGKSVKIYNLGRQWYSTLHTLINFEANIRHHKPDIIIVMHAINDLLQNADRSYFSHGEFRDDYGHFYGPVNNMITKRDFWTDKFGSIGLWYAKPRTELEIDRFPGLVPFRRNLITIIDLAVLDGARVVLMTQPFLYKHGMTDEEKSMLSMVNIESYGPDTYWSHDSAMRGMQAYNNETRAVARERGTYLIDLETAIPKTTQFFWDDVHYRDATYDLIADFIAQEIEKQRILNATRKTSR